MQRPYSDRNYISVNGKLVRKSRHIMEEMLGRKLTADEIVHHKDGDYLNDDPSNLELTTKYEHRITHMVKGDTRFGGQYLRIVPPSDEVSWCSRCKKFLLKENFSSDGTRWHGLQNRCRKCQSEVRFEKLKRGPLKRWVNKSNLKEDLSYE